MSETPVFTGDSGAFVLYWKHEKAKDTTDHVCRKSGHCIRKPNHGTGKNLLLQEKVAFLTRKLYDRSTEHTSTLGIEGQMPHEQFGQGRDAI